MIKLSEAQLWLVDYLRERYRSHVVQSEYRFWPERRWRFDVAIPAIRLAIEIEGGLYVRGAHVRGQHYESDMEKYNHAAANSWTVLRFTPKQILKGQAKEFLEKYL